MTKKVSKIILYSILGFVGLTAAFSLFTQTPLFRETVRASLYNFLEREVNATVYIGEINGNFITGFTVDTLMMYVDGAPFIESGKLSVQYSPLDLFNNQLTIDSLTLENPSVSLIRWKHGEWNVDRMSKTPPSVDTAVSSFVVSAGSLRIMNATFRLIDSTGQYDSIYIDRNGKPSINFSNILLRNLNVDIGGYYSSTAMAFNIHSLSFAAPKEKFSLSRLSGAIERTETSASVKGLVVSTPSSRLELDASINGIDVFSITDMSDLKRSQVSVNIKPSNVVMNDIHVFLQPLDFMKGKIYLDGELEGNFENLSVRKLNTSFGKSSLALSGTVSNIHQPDDLRLNIISTQSTIHPSDVPALMPFYGIPDYKNLGPLTMEFQFVGKPLDFLAISKITSAAGTATVDGQMVITEENIHYKGILAGRDINLEQVFALEDLRSRLNTKIFVEGKGTSLATLDTEASVEIDSSSFRSIPIQHAKVHLIAKEKKITSELSVQSRDGAIAMTGAIDFRDELRPSYGFSAAVRNLDLAPIMQSSYYRSNLSFDIDRTGTGLTVFNNPSETKIDLYSSSFKGMPLDSTHIVMRWLKDSLNNNTVEVKSPIADGTLEGTFTIEDMVQSIETHLAGLERIYTNQRRIIDTSFIVAVDTGQQKGDRPLQESTIRYDLTLKNLIPISTFFNFPRLEIVGRAQGILSRNQSGTSSSGRISLTKGSYADSTAPVRLKNLRLEYSAQKISPEKYNALNDSLDLTVVMEGDEIGIDNTVLKMAHINIDFANQKGVFFLGTDIDTTISVSASGSIEVDNNADLFNISQFYTKYQGLDVRSAGPFKVTLQSNNLKVDSARFVRRLEEILIRGEYEFGGAISADAVINNFELSDIFFVNTSQKFRETVLAIGGTANIKSKIFGTVENPGIIAHIEGKDISYRNGNFGNLEAVLNYANKKAVVKVEMNDEVRNREGQNFILEGTVPIDLRFTSADERMDIEGLDVTLTANNLSAAVLDVFIPEIDQISGVINGRVNMKGSLLKPKQVGNLRLDSGRVRFEMTGIYYNVAGNIRLDSSKALFSDFSISNLKEDFSDGSVSIGGYISLDGFVPAEYNLVANGELLVLQDRSQTSNQSFFGRLVGRTGPKGLRFEGTFDRSRVIGDIFVEDAFLTFPPTQQAVSLSAARFGDVSFIDDTSRSLVDSAAAEAVIQALTSMAAAKKNERTFLDGFGYELTIETRGNVRIQMIFNANAGAYEELFAELNGKMVLKKDETTQQLTGTINVGDGSNYKFYKEFKATGSLTFVGDPQNPQLNIIAKYEGIHIKDPIDNPVEERVVVSLEITGNRNNPKVAIGLSTIDESGREIARQGDIENDAITFLLTSSQGQPGQFREELSTYDRNRLGSQLTEAIGGTFINSLLSGMVNDFITKNNIPYVKRVEVRNVTSETDINTILEVSDAVINIGGKVFTDVNNTNVSVQIPVLGKQNRNFIFEVEKKTENADYTSIQAKNILGARLFYRFTF